MRTIAELEERVERLEAAVAAGRPDRDSGELALFGPTWPDGRKRTQRFPKYWHDRDVREAVIRLHRTMTIDQALGELVSRFGHDRSPSRTALHRVWQQIDEAKTAVGANRSKNSRK
ncbi:MAG: hypothetical protein C0472_03555 [Erythrobacter sp.]|nr:hypothetical protein [Erythrobacter sp.]MBA4173919.1 hypothetical protein [Hyphomicrobium sp.]